MSNKLFTDEEVAALKASPHVAGASSRSVAFTPGFKKQVYQEMLAGKDIAAILEAHGIDTGALGRARINGLVERLRKEGEREDGFADVRRRRNGPRTPEEKQVSAEKRIRQLELELAYTRQEVEFLKKVQAADLEAREAWASKHRQK